MLCEGSAPQQLIDAVNGEESCYVGTEVVGHCDPHSMSCNHLHTRNKKVILVVTLEKKQP